MEQTATETEAGWEVEITTPKLGFLEYVISDHVAARSAPEPRSRTLLLLLPRILLNPSLLFAFTVRLAQCGPVAVQFPVRLFQVAMFSSEIYWFNRPGALEIGPGICFPHPINIIISGGTRIGSNVRIYHNANIGTDRDFIAGEEVSRGPVIGDGATIYSYCVVQGPWKIGEDSVIGVRVMVDEDVPPGALKTLRRLRRRGEWRDERPRRRGARA
jgi:serine O-acetyltransferase